MKWFITTILLFVLHENFAQKNDSTLIFVSKNFHKMLVKNDFVLENKLDDVLSYGHSNGWIETKTEMLQNLASKYIVYNNIEEDSMQQQVNKKIGYVRFVANFNVTLNGKQSVFRLKVLEVWRKRNGSWKLFARQAVRG